jgi:competence protein ComEC
MPVLPSPGVSAVLCITAALVALRWARMRVVMVFVAALGWTCWHAHNAVSLRLDPRWEGEDVRVRGQVEGLVEQRTDHARFTLRPLEAHVDARVGTMPVDLRGVLRLSIYAPLRAPEPGARVELTVRMKRPHGSVNPGGFDFERYAATARIAATGYVRALHAQTPAPAWHADALRQRISTRIAEVGGEGTGTALLRALAVGDQQALSTDAWDALRATSTAHLVAISGFHIGLVAGLFALLVWVAYRLLPRLSLRWPRAQAQALGALIGAFGYALLAGPSLPVWRTVTMIAVVAGARCLRIAMPASQSLATAAIVQWLLDPLAVAQASFWLSFMGVAWLIFCLDGRPAASLLVGYARAQWAMTLGLLPLCLVFFGQISLVGPLANALAIPLVSLLLVPALLLAVAVDMLMPGIGALLLHALCRGADALWPGLDAMADWPWAQWHAPAPHWLALGLGLLGAALVLMPRAFAGRWLGLALLVPLLWPPTRAPTVRQFDVLTLDVGQGLSVLVRTAHHALLFDAAAAWPDGLDRGQATVVPALQALGVRRLDALVVSHADTDHAGGANSVRRALRPRREYGGPDVGHGQTCAVGQAWSWDGVQFEFLHPPPHYPALGNQSSCVLRVSTAANAVLLTGDIDSTVEQTLAREQHERLRAALLLVPHHGSASSSSAAFVNAVAPAWAVVSAGYRNRFGHPRADVLARYRAQGACALNTAEAGAIWARVTPDVGVSWIRALRDEPRYWREPLPTAQAGSDCYRRTRRMHRRNRHAHVRSG